MTQKSKSCVLNSVAAAVVVVVGLQILDHMTQKSKSCIQNFLPVPALAPALVPHNQDYMTQKNKSCKLNSAVAAVVAVVLDILGHLIQKNKSYTLSSVVAAAVVVVVAENHAY